MKTIKLEKYISKKVKIILFNGNKIQGVLRKAKVPFTGAYALDTNNEGTKFFKENHVKYIEVLI